MTVTMITTAILFVFATGERLRTIFFFA